jgi:hypothetical protein
MKRIYLILFVLIALPFATFAQNVNNHNVSGTIIDGENGEPLPIAAVQILSLPDSAQAKGVVTDMNLLTGKLSVKLDRNPQAIPQTFKREDVKLIKDAKITVDKAELDALKEMEGN